MTGSVVSSLDSHTESSAAEPILIEPDAKDQIFINLNFEQNPLNSVGNKRFMLSSKSLKLIYHAITVNNIVYFFRTTESFQQKK